MLVNYNDYKDGGSHKSFTISVVGENITVTNENMRQDSITLDEALCSERNLRFGCCESSQFSVHIANVFENFEGKQIQVSVTMDNKTTKYGTFKVKSDKPTADRIHRKLVAYDAMNDIINTNVLTWFKGLTFPITLKNFRDSFFSYLGITQETRSLINDDFVILGGFTASDSLSGRLIITSICELNGVFGHINRDGKFDYIDLTASSSFDCPPYENNSVKYEDYITSAITKVTMRGTASDVGTSVGTDGNEYIIQGNPLIYGSEGKPALVTAMTRLLNKIKNVVFRPFELGKTIGNPCVELGDAISIETKYETIESYVLRRTLTGIQALRDKYSAEGDDVYPAGVSTLQDEISRTKGKLLEIESSVDGLRITAEEMGEEIDNVRDTTITNDVIHRLATNLTIENVDYNTQGWDTQTELTAINQYLYTYHTFTYGDNHTANSVITLTGRYGQDGTTTTVYELSISSAAVNKAADSNTFNPSSITLTAKSQTGSAAPQSYSGRFKIETTTNGSSWTSKYTSDSNESSTTWSIPTNINSLKAIRCSLYQAGGTTVLLDQQTVPIVSDGSKGDPGQQGGTGPAGADAYTVILTNENHTFAGSNTAAIASNTECGIIAYKGATQVAATIGTITGAPTGMTVTPSGSGTTSAKFTVAVTTSMTTKNGVLTVPVTVDGKTFNMKFTYSLALKGDPGSAARRYDLIVSHAAVNKAATSDTYNPASITVSATYQDGTANPAAYSGRFKIDISTDGSTYTNAYTSQSNQSSYTYILPTDTTLKDIKVSLYLAGGTTTLLDSQTVPIVVDGTDGQPGTPGTPGADGKDAYTVILTNENHTFAGTNTAAIASSTECGIIAYKGATQIAATIGTISGAPTGMSVTKSGSGTTSAKFTVAVTTDMTTKNGVLTIPVTVDSKTFNMKFTYSLALKGDPGSTARRYDLIMSHAAINKLSTANTFNPAAITLSAKYQDGQASPANYAGRFRIETTTDNSAWTTQYESASNESSKSWSIPTNINDLKAIRCSLYLAGGLTTLLDTQTLPIVTDGTNGDPGQPGTAGKDAYTVVLTNENHTFAGSKTAAIASSTECAVIAYKGATQVAATLGTITGAPTGMTVTPSGSGTTSAKFTVAVTTSMTTKNGVLTVPVTVDGKTFNMKFTYSLALKGDDGENGLPFVWNMLWDSDRNALTKVKAASARYVESASTGTYSYTFDEITDAPVPGIKYAYHLTQTSGSNAKHSLVFYNDSTAKPTILLVSGKKYTLSLYCKWISGADAAKVVIQTYDGTSHVVNRQTLNKDGEWHKYSYTFTAGEKMSTAIFRAYMGGCTTSGDSSNLSYEAMFCGFKLEEGEVATEWALHPDETSGIRSVTSLRYASNSTTAPAAPTSEVTRTDTATGVWTKGIPALNDTYKYMYTCDQIQYDSGQFTWTTVVRDNAITDLNERVHQAELKVEPTAIVATVSASGTFATSEEFDNLQIGAENLLRHTRTFDGWLNKNYITVTSGDFSYVTLQGSSTGWNSLDSKLMSLDLLTGGTFVFSFDYSCNSNIPIVLTVAGTSVTDRDSATQPRTKYTGMGANNPTLPSTSNTWKRVSFTSKSLSLADFTSGSGDVNLWYIQIYNRSDTTIKIRKIKLEVGNRASDWSANAEDSTDYTDSIYSGCTQMLWDTNASALTRVDGPTTRYIEQTNQTDYTGAIEAITDAPINGIKYGFHITQTGTSYSHAPVFYSTDTGLVGTLKAGQKYTISLYYKWVSGTSVKRIVARVHVNQTGSGIDLTLTDNVIQDGKWHQASVTFTATQDMESYGFRIYFGRFRNSSNAIVVHEGYFCGWKLEAGNKATSWSEHPDHFASESELKLTKNQIVMKVTTGGRLVTAALSANPSTGTSFSVSADDITMTAEQAINFLSGGDINLTGKNITLSTTGGAFGVLADGTMTAKKGTIGGWNINATSINKSRKISSNTYECAINAPASLTENSHAFAITITPEGGGTAPSKPFYVTYGGSLFASKGTIGGWSISGSDLSKEFSSSGYGVKLSSSIIGRYETTYNTIECGFDLDNRIGYALEGQFGKLSAAGAYYIDGIANVFHGNTAMPSGALTVGEYAKITAGTNTAFLRALNSSASTVGMLKISDGGLVVENGSGTYLSTTTSFLELRYSTPFIDFHHSNSSLDYTTRVITTNYGELTFNGKNSSGTDIYTTLKAAAFTVVSSKHNKKNIKNITEKEAKKLLELRPVSFDYRHIKGDNQRGLIAEEVLEVMPEMVSVPEGYTEYDKNHPDNVPSIDYSKFVPYLIKMVQIQQKEIDDLKK